MDKVSPQKRSEIMSRVHSKNTMPELILRRLIFSLGYRYRLHVSTLPGKPDLVFPKKKKAIFVHGCFWHSHINCVKAKAPKSRLEFWIPKLKQNAIRDQRNQSELSALSWQVLVVWQCELKDMALLKNKIIFFLNK